MFRPLSLPSPYDYTEVGLVRIDLAGEDDPLLNVGKRQGQLGHPVSRCGIAVSVALGYGQEALVREELETKINPFLDRDPMVVEERPGDRRERPSAIPAFVSPDAVAGETIGLDAHTPAASAAVYLYRVEHLDLEGIGELPVPFLIQGAYLRVDE